MKVLLINGSPHEKGCTYTALSLIAGELNAAGIETEILNVGTKPVGGCIGCGVCGHLPGLVHPEADAVAALVLESVQSHLCRVGGDVEAGLVALRLEAVAGAGSAEPDFPVTLTHSVFPPLS